MPDVQAVKRTIKQLRDLPANTTGAGQDVLLLISDYLVEVSPKEGTVHWFCRKADQLTIDCATFLLRLHAYDSSSIQTWRNLLTRCLRGCCDCVRGLAEAKVTSRHTFFGAFPEDTLNNFWADFANWEKTIILACMRDKRLISTSKSSSTLNDIPLAVLCHVFTSLDVFLNPEILKVIRSTIPASASILLPVDPYPPGLLLLAFDEDQSSRTWARLHLRVASQLTKDQLVGHYLKVLESVAAVLSDQPPPLSFPFSKDPVILWSGFGLMLRSIPPEYYTTTHGRRLEFNQIVLGHVHDNGQHFVDVLRPLVVLLKRMGTEIWSVEGNSPEYPQVIFDAIKDNKSFIAELEKPEPPLWLLGWFMDYLSTIWTLPVLGSVVAKMVDFLCDELQHERFVAMHPLGILTAARLLTNADKRARTENSTERISVFAHVLDIHSSAFVSRAFDRRYSKDSWSEARKGSRELVRTALINDTRGVADAITRLSKRLMNSEQELVVPSIRKQMWKEMYDKLGGSDVDGLAVIIAVQGSSAHMDSLSQKPFRDLAKKVGGNTVVNIVTAIDNALTAFRAGFLDAISKFANYTTSSAVLDLLKTPGMTRDIMALMLSPIEDNQMAAQTLIGQAFDVDVRQDCFRALLENLPHTSFNGIFDVLDQFINYAALVPEACSLSKSVVRCMTDVIDVLCSSENGLLRRSSYLKKGAEGHGTAEDLPKWWKLMARSISIIFRRTPGWSLFFGTKEMVEWMRDALIFGRDMLAQWRVIESAALIGSPEAATLKPGRMSRLGRRMVEDLKEVLIELGRWLRLTDEELLYQSFALLETLLGCFKETGISPPEEAIRKFTKTINDARNKDPNRPQTRLDSSRILRLENALAAFKDDDDDEVEIVSGPVKKEETDSDVEIIDGPPPQKTVNQKLMEASKTAGKAKVDGQKLNLSVGFTPASATIKDQSISRFFTKESRESSKDRIKEKEKEKEKKDIIPSRPAVPVRKPSTLPQKPQPPPPQPSSDESSDESAEETGFAALGGLQRKPSPKKKLITIERKPVERRGIQLMDLPGGNAALRNRFNRRDESRRTQMRLKPDISGFHRVLLSWNYDHEGQEPPFVEQKPRYMHVMDRFSGFDQYGKVFQPLLMMECWAQIVKSKDEPVVSYSCTVSNRQYVDDWIDVDLSITDPPREWTLADTDVVLLRGLGGEKSVLAKAQAYKPSQFGGCTATVRCVSRCDPGLTSGTKWSISKVFSLSTLHREYAALVALPYYDLADVIFNPKLVKAAIDRREVQASMEKYGVNEPQAGAIVGAMKTEGFSLIQGPPGTGKTSTICGLVQAHLAKRARPATKINVGRGPSTGEKTCPPKILLCAPSNAAIDEVAHRLKDGILGGGKRGLIPKVVRVGADSAINATVKDISLDFLVDQKVNSDPDSAPASGSTTEIAVVRRELDSVKKERQKKLEELSQTENNTAKTTLLEDEIKRLNQKRMTLTQQVDRLRDKNKADSRALDAARRKIRSEILQEADVICGTLSGSGHEALQLEQFDFEMVIIDEAAQAIELSTLIPLKHKCNRCILVGDPQQLPPTVLSLEACKYQYNQSLFVRFQKDNPAAVHLLSIQYRMHPEISLLPSRVFYQGKLLDGPNMDVKTGQPWHLQEKFGPYKFFNVSGQEETGRSHSLINRSECQMAVALYARLCQEFSNFDFDFRVGVISMYRAQIGELKRAFVQRFGQDIVGKILFHTVDGFQGQEKDVIILSCVRAGPGLQKIGFLADTRRMNVALTRARSSLFILGNVSTLERSDENWRQIVQDARSRQRMVDATISYFTSQSNRVLPTPIAKPKAAPVTPLPLKETEPQIPELIKPKDVMKLPVKRVASANSLSEQGTDGAITTTVSTTSTEKPVPPLHTNGQPTPKPNGLPAPPQDPRPKKRPKPQPRPNPGASLFIPSKKRPPPDADMAGPSKRRH